jgi:hypothetical protein
MLGQSIMVTREGRGEASSLHCGQETARKTGRTRYPKCIPPVTYFPARFYLLKFPQFPQTTSSTGKQMFNI